MVGRADDEALGLVWRDPLLETGNVLGERAGLPVDVDHRPAVPLADRHRHEAVVGAVEPRRGLVAGGRQQRSVEAVVPAVVRAVDRAVPGGHVARRQLMAAVLAHVEETAQHAVIAAHEEHPVVTDLDRPPGSGRSQVVDPPGRHPTAVEEVGPFPRQYGVVRVRRGGQHRPGAAGVEHRRELSRSTGAAIARASGRRSTSTRTQRRVEGRGSDAVRIRPECFVRPGCLVRASPHQTPHGTKHSGGLRGWRQLSALRWRFTAAAAGRRGGAVGRVRGRRRCRGRRVGGVGGGRRADAELSAADGAGGGGLEGAN